MLGGEGQPLSDTLGYKIDVDDSNQCEAKWGKVHSVIACQEILFESKMAYVVQISKGRWSLLYHPQKSIYFYTSKLNMHLHTMDQPYQYFSRAMEQPTVQGVWLTKAKTHLEAMVPKYLF